MNPETNSEIGNLIKNINGIVIIGEGGGGKCPLAKLILEESGTTKLFQDLGEPITTATGIDYKPYMRVPKDLACGPGDIQLANKREPFKVSIVNVGGKKGVGMELYTLYKDNEGRPTNLKVFITGVDNITSLPESVQWSFFKSLFSGITFSEGDVNMNHGDLDKLANEKVIPHLALPKKFVDVK